MDWSIFCADSLTGLIVACALVLPSRKLADVSVGMVLKKFKSSSFAAGTRREDIALCQEKLGIPLEEFIAISLKAMQEISEELGL
jgi:predicted hydrolase (HD superfamily)